MEIMLQFMCSLIHEQFRSLTIRSQFTVLLCWESRAWVCGEKRPCSHDQEEGACVDFVTHNSTYRYPWFCAWCCVDGCARIPKPLIHLPHFSHLWTPQQSMTKKPIFIKIIADWNLTLKFHQNGVHRESKSTHIVNPFPLHAMTPVLSSR